MKLIVCAMLLAGFTGCASKKPHAPTTQPDPPQGLTSHFGTSHRAAAGMCGFHHGPFSNGFRNCTVDNDCPDPNTRCAGDPNARYCGRLCGTGDDCSDPSQRCLPHDDLSVCTVVLSCQQDSDCRPGNKGCVVLKGQSVCSIDLCTTDADCGPGKVCECGSLSAFTLNLRNYCVPANCSTDADCAAETSCSATVSDVGYGAEGYYCHTLADTCTNVSDCPPPTDPGDRALCQFQGIKWVCNYSNAEE